jgi:putative ABC transport system permease protein
MISNYIKIALRFMMRQKGFSMINIAGLTIGITCCLLIVLFIRDEVSYDAFHRDADRIYRLGFEGTIDTKSFRVAQTGIPVARALQKEFNEVESTLRLASWQTFPVRYDKVSFTEDKLLLADANFFQFFDFRLVSGHPDSVLSKPRQLVITESAAARYFGYRGRGDTSPLGKTVSLAQGYDVKVTGIAEDPPTNSHLHYSLVLSLMSWEGVESGSWLSPQVYTYFKTKSDASVSTMTPKFDVLIKHYVGLELQRLHQGDLTTFKEKGNVLTFFVQPLLSLHLTSHLSDEIEMNGDMQYVYIFGAVAFLIMVLACINFMNLSTARSASRAREVGIRKSVGAQNGRLIQQFLLESYIYIGVSLALSLFLIIGLLPVLNLISGKHLRFSMLFDVEFLAGSAIVALLIGLLAGSYPAFYLTRFNPIEVLKGQLRSRLRSYGIRNMLVVFQFTISTSLMIATMIVYLQLYYIHSANTGFDKADLVNLLHTKNLGENGGEFKTELMRTPFVSSASYANRLPPNVEWQFLFIDQLTGRENLFSLYEMDADHLETMRYSMAAGRFFSGKIPSDTTALILNETAAQQLGITDFDGRKMVSTYDQDGRVREIIGIIHDFHFRSFRVAVQPLAIVMGPEPKWEMASRITRGECDQKLQTIRSCWG